MMVRECLQPAYFRLAGVWRLHKRAFNGQFMADKVAAVAFNRSHKIKLERQVSHNVLGNRNLHALGRTNGCIEYCGYVGFLIKNIRLFY